MLWKMEEERVKHRGSAEFKEKTRPYCQVASGCLVRAGRSLALVNATWVKYHPWRRAGLVTLKNIQIIITPVRGRGLEYISNRGRPATA